MNRRVLVPAMLGVLLGLLASCGDDSIVGPSADEVSTAESVVTVVDPLVEAGDETRLRLETRDAAGNRIRSGGLSVSFHAQGAQAVGASAGTIGAADDLGDGTYEAMFAATAPGNPVSIGATIDGDTVTSSSPTVRVTAGPASPGASDLVLSTRQLDVGGVAQLELVVRDAGGFRVADGGAAVAFTAMGGTSDGTVGATVDHGNGSYTAPFTASAVGSALTIRATLDGAAVPDTDSLRVVAGPASPAASELTVSVDTVTVGTVVQLVLRARDTEGRGLVGGGRTVVFTASVGDGVSEGAIEADSVDLGDGTYTADFRATKAGTATTIGATIDGEPVDGPLPTITVEEVDASAQTSVVTVGDEALVAGDSTVLTLTVFGPDSTAVTSGGLTVEFVPGDEPGAGGGEVSEVTDHGDGSYTATFTARRAGVPVPISATMDETPVEMLDSLGVSHLPTIAVSPGPVALDSSFVEVGSDELALGETTLLRLRTRDAFGNQLTDGGLAVELTATADVTGGPVGEVGPVTDETDGSYTAVYTATDEVTALISASIDGQPITSDSVPIIALCSTGVVSPATSAVTVNDTVLRSGVGTTVTLFARDADGHCLRNTGHSVVFGAGGGTSTGTFSATVDQGDGSYAATLTGIVAGTPATVTATIDGEAVTSSLPEVRVEPGDVSAAASEIVVERPLLDVGAASRIDLLTRDAAGNALETGGLGVDVFVSGGTSAGTMTGVTDNADGTYFVRFTATGVGSPLDIDATIDGNAVGSSAPIIEVVAGPISVDSSLIELVGGIVSGDTTTIAAGDTITATLAARDAEGRPLVGGGRTVVFSLIGGTSDGTFLSSPAIDEDDGTYTSEFVGAAAGSAVTVGATIDGDAVTSELPALVVE